MPTHKAEPWAQDRRVAEFRRLSAREVRAEKRAERFDLLLATICLGALAVVGGGIVVLWLAESIWGLAL